MNKRLILFCFLFGLVIAGSAYALRTVIIMNDVFVDFAVTSNSPYWINDSQIVHNLGRVDYLNDGKYLLTNGRTYYDIMNRAYGEKISRIWAEKTNGDFQIDVLDYHNNKEQINFSYDLDLQRYWKERKQKVVGAEE